VRRATAGAVAAFAALLAFGVAASPAWAHARLLHSSPADNTTVTEPVTTVTLTFSEPVKQRSTTIVVSGSDGASYSDGAARVIDTDVTQAVRPLRAGPVRVTWRTVSADGDPIQGEFGFTVVPTAAPTSAAPSPTPPATGQVPPSAATSPRDTADTQPTRASVPWVWVSIGAGVLAVLAGGVVWWRRRLP
jgi:methionine-rich copper-binding protein CopC